VEVVEPEIFLVVVACLAQAFLGVVLGFFQCHFAAALQFFVIGQLAVRVFSQIADLGLAILQHGMPQHQQGGDAEQHQPENADDAEQMHAGRD